MTTYEWVGLLATGAGLVTGYLMGRAEGRQLGETKEVLRELKKPPRPFLKFDEASVWRAANAKALSGLVRQEGGVHADVYPDW